MRVKAFTVAVIALVSAGLVGCGGIDESGQDDTDETADALRWRRRPRPPAPAPAPAPTSGSGTSLDAIIAAAQTPDGRAIPQNAGPNGECPAVVAALGFWSCLNINETCRFQSGGRLHECTCIRTDGEGQLPSWSCN